MSNKNITHLFSGPMAIEPKALAAIKQAIKAFYADDDMSNDIPDVDDTADELEMYGALACIYVDGVLTKQPSIYQALLGGTSSLELANTLKTVASNQSIGQILLILDSPGGEIAGIDDVVSTINSIITSGKPVHCYISDMACSAAYEIASQCSTITCNQSASVGCIGVYQTMYDYSELYKQEGIKTIVASSGKNKGLGVPGTVITEDQIASVQKEIDVLAELFVNTVANGRNMSIESVKALADGSCLIGQSALTAGLVDAVDTLQNTINKLAGSNISMPIQENNMSENTNMVKAADVKQETIAIDNGLKVKNEVLAGASVASVEAPQAPVAASVELEAPTDALARLRALQAAFPADPAFALEQFNAGHDTPKAKAVHVEMEVIKSANELKIKEAKQIEESAKQNENKQLKTIGAKPLAFVASSSDDDKVSKKDRNNNPVDYAKKMWASNENIRSKHASESAYIARCKYNARYGK